MSVDTIEELCKGLFDGDFLDDEPSVEFLWHAGEPLTVGLPYFRKAIEIIKNANTAAKEVTHSIQTNGLLIDTDWCDFFKEHQINIGFSVDGPAFLHDRNRIGWTGKPSHAIVMEKYCLLRSQGISSGALCVLTREHLKYPKEILEFFLENNFPSIGFNVEEIENCHSSSSLNKVGSYVSNEVIYEFENFLSELFDLWLPHSGRIDIREFQDLFNILHLKNINPDYQRIPDEVQDLTIITVQKDGSISTYSPEFAGAKSTKYFDFIVGNVHENGLKNIKDKKSFQAIKQGIDRHKIQCEKTCQYFDYCGGSYASNVFFERGTLDFSESTACRLLRKSLFDVLTRKLSHTVGTAETGFSVTS